MSRAVEICDDGLVFGAGTRLARMAGTGQGRRLAIDADRERVLALLSVVCRRPVGAEVLVAIEAASSHWQRGDKALANLRLAFAGLPRLDDPHDAARLRLAEYCLDEGLPPRALMQELGLDASALGLGKYNGDEPRDARGRWTVAEGAASPTDSHQSWDVATPVSGNRTKDIIFVAANERPPPFGIPTKVESETPGTRIEDPLPFAIDPFVVSIRPPGGGIPVEVDPGAPALPAVIGPGPFAGKSVPAGPSARPTPAQKAEVAAIGRETGCHTCGTTDPGTSSGMFYCDHQTPTSLNDLNQTQCYFPHSQKCSGAQGDRITKYLRTIGE